MMNLKQKDIVKINSDIVLNMSISTIDKILHSYMIIDQTYYFPIFTSLGGHLEISATGTNLGIEP